MSGSNEFYVLNCTPVTAKKQGKIRIMKMFGLQYMVYHLKLFCLVLFLVLLLSNILRVYARSLSNQVQLKRADLSVTKGIHNSILHYTG